MAIIRTPFTPTRLEEERAKDDSEVVGLKLNRQEREELEEMKATLDIQGDSQTIKMLYAIGRRVVFSTFSADQLAYLVSQKRTRYDGRKKRRI